MNIPLISAEAVVANWLNDHYCEIGKGSGMLSIQMCPYKRHVIVIVKKGQKEKEEEKEKEKEKKKNNQYKLKRPMAITIGLTPETNSE